MTPKITTVKDLDWDLEHPCGDCPFLKSSPFHEGVATALVSHCESIDEGKFAHTCHRTDNREACDGPKNWTKGKPKHCAGAILMLLKTGNGKDLQLPLLQAAEAGLFDIHRMAAIAEKDTKVFTMDEMFKFYLREIKRRGLEVIPS